jgi:hypothetical protein
VPGKRWQLQPSRQDTVKPSWLTCLRPELVCYDRLGAGPRHVQHSGQQVRHCGRGMGAGAKGVGQGGGQEGRQGGGLG